MNKLWTDVYRPDSLNGYVLKDAIQKKQIESWLDHGTIPHLLFSGSAGVGKCIDGNELIEVEIETDTLTKKQCFDIHPFLKEGDS